MTDSDADPESLLGLDGNLNTENRPKRCARRLQLEKLSERSCLDPWEEVELAKLEYARSEDFREAEWYEYCLDHYWEAADGSVQKKLWWALRMEDTRKWSTEGDSPLLEWIEYAAFKLEGK